MYVTQVYFKLALLHSVYGAHALFYLKNSNYFSPHRKNSLAMRCITMDVGVKYARISFDCEHSQIVSIDCCTVIAEQRPKCSHSKLYYNTTQVT